MSDKGMSNKEYLEKVKKDDETLSMNDLHEKDIEYRKVKALEIMAEELIHTREFLCGLTEIYKDLVIDVNKVKEKITTSKKDVVIKPMGKMGKNEKTNNTH